jgi:hypothetical protein
LFNIYKREWTKKRLAQLSPLNRAPAPKPEVQKIILSPVNKIMKTPVSGRRQSVPSLNVQSIVPKQTPQPKHVIENRLPPLQPHKPGGAFAELFPNRQNNST